MFKNDHHHDHHDHDHHRTSKLTKGEWIFFIIWMFLIMWLAGEANQYGVNKVLQYEKAQEMKVENFSGSVKRP